VIETYVTNVIEREFEFRGGGERKI
jgi:hypothetical protein